MFKLFVEDPESICSTLIFLLHLGLRLDYSLEKFCSLLILKTWSIIHWLRPHHCKYNGPAILYEVAILYS